MMSLDDLADEKSLDLMTCLKGHKGAVLTLDFSPTTNLLVSGGEEKVIMLWDLTDVDSSDDEQNAPYGRTHPYIGGATNIPSSTSTGSLNNLSNNRHGLSSRRLCRKSTLRGTDSSFFVEKQTTKILGENQRRLSNRWRRLEHGNDDSHVLSVSFGPGYFVSGYMNGKAKLWKLTTKVDEMPEPSSCQSYSCHQSPTRSVSCCQTRPEFCTASEKVVRVWSAVGKNKMLSSLAKGHTNHVRSAKWSRIDEFVIGSCGDDGRICIWDTRIPFEPTSEIKRNLQFTSLDWHPVYNYNIATGSRDSICRVWDLRKNECIQPYDQHTGPVNSVAFNEGGTVLLSGSDDKKCKMFDVLEFRPLFTMGGHKRPVSSVCFSKAGDLFASGSHDKSINIYKSNIKSCVIIPDCTEDSVLEVNDTPEDTTSIEIEKNIVDERCLHHKNPSSRGCHKERAVHISGEKISNDRHDFCSHCTHHRGIKSATNPKIFSKGVNHNRSDSPEPVDGSMPTRDTTDQKILKQLKQIKDLLNSIDLRVQVLEKDKRFEAKARTCKHSCGCDHNCGCR